MEPIMSHTRDYQKSKCYAWENKHIGSLDRSRVPFENIQSIVDYIWKEMGFVYPPKVRATKRDVLGDATRMTVRFQEKDTTPTWVIIHELAHTLTSTVENNSDHGPDFVWIYMKMIDKFIPGANLITLMTTAKAMNVKFNPNARPTILD